MAQLQTTSITGSLKIGNTQDLSADASIWYNNPTGEIYYTYSGSSWSAGGFLNTLKALGAAAGTSNSGLAFGGIGSALSNLTEAYNGSTWSIGGNLIYERRYLGGAGTQNAALAFGGCSPTTGYPPFEEEYNGTSWSTGGSLIIKRRWLSGAGVQNSALAFGGDEGGPVYQSTATEEYDGATWTTGGNLSCARYSLGGAGTQNAGIAFGGYGYSDPGPPSVDIWFNSTEEYNGSTWSTQANLIYKTYLNVGGGTQNVALSFAGTGAYAYGMYETELYDGTSWFMGGKLNMVRCCVQGNGNSSSGFVAGTRSSQNTEEYITGIVECKILPYVTKFTSSEIRPI